MSLIPPVDPCFMLYCKAGIDVIDIGVIKYFYSKDEMVDFINRLRVAKLSNKEVVQESYVPVSYDDVDLQGLPSVVDLMLPFEYEA